MALVIIAYRCIYCNHQVKPEEYDRLANTPILTPIKSECLDHFYLKHNMTCSLAFWEPVLTVECPACKSINVDTVIRTDHDPAILDKMFCLQCGHTWEPEDQCG